MKIVVCIKQVPDTSEVRIDPETNTLVREGVESIFNPLDTFALEEAVRIRERMGGEVIALSMGPPQAEEALREAIALGADRARLLSGRELAGADTLATSFTLASAIRNERDVDLILCGKQAIDGDTAQVGPGIAAHLDIPQLTYVRKIREITEDRVVAECLTDVGFDVLEAPLPVVMTVVKELNDPRLPSLVSWVVARSADVSSVSGKNMGLSSDEIGLNGSPTKVWKISTPDTRGNVEMLSSDPAKAVGDLMKKLEDRGIVC